MPRVLLLRFASDLLRRRLRRTAFALLAWMPFAPPNAQLLLLLQVRREAYSHERGKPQLSPREIKQQMLNAVESELHVCARALFFGAGSGGQHALCQKVSSGCCCLEQGIEGEG